MTLKNWNEGYPREGRVGGLEVRFRQALPQQLQVKVYLVWVWC